MRTKCIFIDCETSGTDPYAHALLQIAGAVFIDGKFVEKFNYRMRPFPDNVLDSEALKVNGLTLEQIQGWPDPEAVWLELLNLLNRHSNRGDRQDKFHIIGYNGDFDAGFIRAFCERMDNQYTYNQYFWWPTLDVAKLAGQRLMRVRHELVNFKLRTVAKHLGIPVDPARLHEADYDVGLTIDMYRILAKGMPSLIVEQKALTEGA